MNICCLWGPYWLRSHVQKVMGVSCAKALTNMSCFRGPCWLGFQVTTTTKVMDEEENTRKKIKKKIKANDVSIHL
jgi:hypothetical protein